MELQKGKYGWIATIDGRKELWMKFSEKRFPDLVEEHRVMTWTTGNCNIVISIPHAGTLGCDTTPVGSLVCESGQMLETRRGNMEFPIKTLARDAGTDVIGAGVSKHLEQEGLKPHMIELHMHRSKVEPNSKLEEMGVQVLKKEGEFIHKLYHQWISQALEMGKEEAAVPVALLVDLHGHPHPHDYIELGLRLPTSLLNQISNEKVKGKTWKSILTTSVREEFTMTNLLNRKFEITNKSVREAVIGPTSFSGCLSSKLAQVPSIQAMQCIPSVQKPAPGRLGFFAGNYIVKRHSKEKGIDAVQIELPMSVRTQQDEKREGVILALAEGIREFHDLHFTAASVGSIGTSWL